MMIDGDARGPHGQHIAVSHRPDPVMRAAAETGLLALRAKGRLQEIEMTNMIALAKTLVVGLAIGVLYLTLPGCQRQEGPAERAGKQVDQTVEKVGQQIEKAGENIQDAAKDAKK